MGIEHARRARASRGVALAKVRQGRLLLADVLRNPPDALRTVHLYDVLLACPRISNDRCRTVCERARVWPHLELGQLTKQERAELIRHIPSQAVLR